VNSRTLSRFIALTLAVGGCGGATTAYAQQGRASADSLEEIIVTARKREEVLMEVPVAISVLTANDLELKGVKNLQDVALFTPGLSYFDAIQNQLGTPVVRGVSQTNLNSPDRNVAIFYGGVYLANSNASNLELLDLERVEVVKGPQSALYGRNAFMGAINFVPAAPTQDLFAHGEITIGSDERLESRIRVAGPLTDTLGGRLAVSRNTFDGTWDNIGDPSNNLGGYETTNVSGVLQWDPSEAFSARLFGFWTDDRRDSSPQYCAALNCGPTAVPTVICGDIPVQREIGADPEALAFSREVSLLSFDASYDFGPMSLAGQVAYYKADMDNYSDYQTGAHSGEGSVFSIVNVSAPTVVLRQQAVPYFVGSGRGDSESWSVELRLESDQEQRLRWMAGGFYFENEAHHEPLRLRRPRIAYG
jgi:iron complex outermembrane receptor protein